MDAYQVSFDTAWEWAERRGVRVDFWRDEADREWQVEVILNDTEGDFTGSAPLPVFRLTRGSRRNGTQAELREAYIKEARKSLDHAVSEARFRRGIWQQRRLH